ncbi:MAG: glycosyltransferase family 39 protein [Bacteroidales bacterium]
MKNFIYLILICSVLIGCTSKEPHEKEVAFYSFNGNYLSADKCMDSMLIANKHEKHDWETFLLKNIEGNTYTIKTKENIFVAVDTSKSNRLFANQSKLTKDCKFEIMFDEKYERLSIKAANGKYVCIGKDDILTADSDKSSIISSVFIDKGKNQTLNSYFDDYQLIFLINALLLIFLSILFFNFRKKINLSLVFLLLGGILLRVFAVSLDPYLNLWDERFHALVAKSMLENPLKPMLYANPVLPYFKESWSVNHIWLHKQPLFLWQIALFFKLFGYNEIILRIPSLIMSSVSILFTYRIARLTCNKKIAYYAALLFTTSYFTIELVSGKTSTDHNDIAFAFYITASIWAWTEFYFSKNRKWIICIGLFAGMAILNKWLSGLLVYAGWGMAVLSHPIERKRLVNYLNIWYAFIITIIVALPWQLYILYKYPIESRFEYKYNTEHLYKAVEGHSGDFFFHFDKTLTIYGVHFLIILVALILLWKTMKRFEYKIAFFSFIILIYLFFSVVATKMDAFTYCISVLIYMGLGSMLYWLFEIIVVNKKYLAGKIYSKSFTTLLLFLVCIYNLNLDKIQYYHSNYQKNRDNYRTQNSTHSCLYKNLNKILTDKNLVLFNASQHDNISIMFYSGITAYDVPITEAIYRDFKKRNIKMATFDTGDLPDFIKNDPEIVVIK